MARVESAMMRWEYKISEIALIATRGVRVHEEALNVLGLDGWEVVSVWVEGKGAGFTARVLLKRPLTGREALVRSGRRYLPRWLVYRGVER